MSPPIKPMYGSTSDSVNVVTCRQAMKASEMEMHYRSHQFCAVVSEESEAFWTRQDLQEDFDSHIVWFVFVVVENIV